MCAISFIIWNIPRHAKNTNNEIIQDEIKYNECGTLCESSPGFNKVAIDSMLNRVVNFATRNERGHLASILTILKHQLIAMLFLIIHL